MQVLFCLLLFLILYCYFGYPLLIYVFAVFFKKKVDRFYIEPTVSVIISIYNEEDCIENKIENLLSLDYPRKWKLLLDLMVRQIEQMIYCINFHHQFFPLMPTRNAEVKWLQSMT